MLDPQSLRRLSAIDAWVNVRAICVDWLVIGVVLGANLWVRHWALLIPSFVLIARQQFALLVLSHDAVHYRLFQSRRWNEGVGAAISAPIYFLMDAYRSIHLKHHQSPQSPEDPNLEVTSAYPLKRAQFVGLIVQDLLGLTYVKLLHRLTRPDSIFLPRDLVSKRRLRTSLAIGGLCNLTLFGVFWVTDAPELYFALWWLPMVTLLQAFMRIRTVVEHAGYPSSEDQRENTRTLIHPTQAFFFGPHNVNYHLEHHLYPSIPWYRLPEAHELLMEREEIPRARVFYSYFDALKEIVV